ncbi:hypothetical protein L0F63_006367 [Massospora cicadina]|nr:hypothetical protein L0F63_006367 [Massospora cicadina]
MEAWDLVGWASLASVTMTVYGIEGTGIIEGSEVHGANALRGDAVAQAATMGFLTLALADYLIYSALFLYVFLFVIFESRTLFKAFVSTSVVVIFVAIRTIFLPMILSMVPYVWVPEVPPLLMEISFYACTSSYIVFFNAPVVACLYFVIRFGFGGAKLKGGIIDGSGKVPMVVILMPIYNEEPAPLFRAVESAIRSDYPSDKLHVLLAFDDESESILYWDLLRRLKVLNREVHQQWRLEAEEDMFLFPPRLELVVEGVRITICRFPHEGKSAAQGKGFRIIDEMYRAQATSTFLMYIDSDVILHDNAVYNFVSTLVTHPKMNAVTGYVTCRTSDRPNLLHYLQDAEYLEGQMFARAIEALAGSVTCLPGALTLLRLSAMQAVAAKYFISFDTRKPLDFHRYYLGEDRYMTHLLMEESTCAYTIGLCGASRCKTEAPNSWAKLTKQRRRWYLGALINEANMLCTPRLWRYMPMLLTLKLFDYASGSLAWLFMVYLVGVIKGVVPLWTICAFFPCLMLKYLILSISASFMNRTKVFITFPIFFFVAPIFKMWCTVYCILTWDTRTWGGPRTDVTANRASSLAAMDELMRRRLISLKRSKKFLKQVEARARIMNGNLERTRKERGRTALPLKHLLPFPYEVDILGGGEYYEDLIMPPNPSQPAVSGQNHLPPIAMDERYLFGKYQRRDPSRTSIALDLASLSRMERLIRSSRENFDRDPTQLSYRLSASTHLPTNRSSSNTNFSSSVSINSLPPPHTRTPPQPYPHKELGTKFILETYQQPTPPWVQK